MNDHRQTPSGGMDEIYVGPTDTDKWSAIVFVLCGVSLIASMRQVDAVVEMPADIRITPVPFTPQWIYGVMNHRGRMLTVVDVEEFLLRERAGDEFILNNKSGDEQGESGGQSRLMIPPGKTASLAFKVDKVEGWRQFDRELAERDVDYIDATVRPIVKTAFAHDGSVWGLVDFGSLIRRSMATIGDAG